MLRAALDQTLEGVDALIAMYQGYDQEEPLGLGLRFSGGVEFGVTNAHDGESVRVVRKLSSPYPQGEEELDAQVMDQTEAEAWFPFVGKKCEDIVEVRDMSFGGKGVWSGLELAFEGGAVLSLYNWGDEFLCLEAPDKVDFLERKTVRKDDDEGSSDGGEGSPGAEGKPGDEGSPGAEASSKKGQGGADGDDDEGGGKPRRRRRRRRRKGGDEEE